MAAGAGAGAGALPNGRQPLGAANHKHNHGHGHSGSGAGVQPNGALLPLGKHEIGVGAAAVPAPPPPPPQRPALFSLRIAADSRQEVVGGADKYAPVCRHHYVSLSKVRVGARAGRGSFHPLGLLAGCRRPGAWQERSLGLAEVQGGLLAGHSPAAGMHRGRCACISKPDSAPPSSADGCMLPGLPRAQVRSAGAESSSEEEESAAVGQ